MTRREIKGKSQIVTLIFFFHCSLSKYSIIIFLNSSEKLSLIFHQPLPSSWCNVSLKGAGSSLWYRWRLLWVKKQVTTSSKLMSPTCAYNYVTNSWYGRNKSRGVVFFIQVQRKGERRELLLVKFETQEVILWLMCEARKLRKILEEVIDR